MEPSRRLKINKTDLIKSAKAFGYAMTGAALLWIGQWVTETDFGESTEFVTAVVGTLVYFGKRWIQDQAGPK